MGLTGSSEIFTHLKIQHFTHNEINKKKWDDCINKSFNGIVYALSWYLDIVSEGWEALVADQYSMVMPLTTGKKYKINYLYQPYFTQQLGVFSSKMLDAKIVEAFIAAIPEKYRFYEINLNTFNKLEQTYAARTNITFELDLIMPYEKIFAGYSENTKRNLKKANHQKITIVNNLPASELIQLFKNNFADKFKRVKAVHYQKIRGIIASALRLKTGEVYGAYNLKNELCAAAFFITMFNKTIFLFSASNPAGKESGAMSLLIDHYVRINSEKNLTLDFEGSNIEGLARFYSGFGAKPCEYFSIKKNKLPFYIKLFKS